MTSTEAFLSERTKVRALYSKKHNEVPLNVWRGGTVVAISDEPYQQREPSDKGDGALKFWSDGNKMMQIDITLQTAERSPADPDDTGLRKVFVPDNGRAPGSLIVEIGNACREAGHGLPHIGGELYIMFAGETPSKNTALADRKLWKAAYRAPANQFFATEVPAAPAPQASSNGQPAQQPAAVAQSAPQQFPSYAGAPAASNHPQWGPSGGLQEQHAPPAQPQQQWPGTNETGFQSAPVAQQAPQWPSSPPQSQPPTAAPPAQQPAAQSQQWPPGGQQAYQPPPVDPRHPFG